MRLPDSQAQHTGVDEDNLARRVCDSIMKNLDDTSSSMYSLANSRLLEFFTVLLLLEALPTCLNQVWRLPDHVPSTLVPEQRLSMAVRACVGD
jgi:hypothetical protein